MRKTDYYIFEPITPDLAKDFLMFLSELDGLKDKVINVYINSPGGCLDSGFAMINGIQRSKHKIRTIGIGGIASAAFMILMSGDERHLYHNALCMSHQYSWGTGGKHHELEASAKAFEIVDKSVLAIYRDASKLPISKIKKELLPANDVYLTPEQVLKYKLVDKILKKGE